MTNEELIMSWLEDEQSKFIFQKRVEYNNTHNFNAIREIVSRYLPQLKSRGYYPGIESEILKKVSGKRVVIFGAGLNGATVLALLGKVECTVKAILDNNPINWEKQLDGITIIKPKTMNFDDVDVVIVTPYKEQWIREIHKQLAEYRVDTNRCEIIDYRDYCPYMLEDEQYFDEGIIQLKSEEVFIDGGVLDLGTSMLFEKLCQKNGVRNYRVYAFEPDQKSFERCNHILRECSEFNIHLCNMGLWSCNDTLYFDGSGTGGSRIVGKQSDSSVEVVSLDSYIKDKVTFLKLDIEGAEMEALKGARYIIKTQKPKLAICVYHKKEDITEIPMYIKHLVPEYKLYLRHYSDDAGETVLYAV